MKTRAVIRKVTYTFGFETFRPGMWSVYRNVPCGLMNDASSLIFLIPCVSIRLSM